jgi:fructose 1,6-bisphosphatase
MKTTLSIIKADIGSLGGHIKPRYGGIVKKMEKLEPKFKVRK